MTTAPIAPADRAAYVKAGNATVTLEGRKSRYTYRVQQKRDSEAGPWFVSVLRGADNEGDYSFLGTLFESGDFRVSGKSPIPPDAPSARAFAWFAGHMEDVRVVVWHEGKCGRCGRKLTTPESIASGLGPVCAEKGL